MVRMRAWESPIAWDYPIGRRWPEIDGAVEPTQQLIILWPQPCWIDPMLAPGSPMTPACFCLGNAERWSWQTISLIDPIDLDALDDYLMSDHAPDDSMGLSDLDGFLTGIVVGPELILPSEWLPVIWGGEEPEFETEDEMRTVLGTIMGRYNEIVACLNSDPDDFDPIFLEGPEGEVIASDWAGGFLDAVALRPMAWKPLMENDGAGILMAPLFLLNGDMEIDDA